MLQGLSPKNKISLGLVVAIYILLLITAIRNCWIYIVKE